MTAGPAAPEPTPPDHWLVTTAHNRTQHPPTMQLGLGSPVLQVWAKASTVRVSTGKPSRAKGPTGRLALQEAEPPDVGTSADPAAAKGTRPERVGAMTRQSRARLMQKLATIDASAPALFITLTWPTWAAPDREQWHRAWDRWRMRLARSWPGAAGLWRREYTKAGVIHLHLLMFNVDTSPAVIRSLQGWTAKAWADVVDAPEYEKRRRVGTSVEVPRAGAAVSRYIAKYVNKVADGDSIERPMGRWWGTFGGSTAIPYTLPDDYPVSEDEARQLLRTARRWLAAKRRARVAKTGKRIKGKAPQPQTSRRIFTDDPALWLRVLACLRCSAPTSPANGPARAAHLQGIA